MQRLRRFLVGNHLLTALLCLALLAPTVLIDGCGSASSSSSRLSEAGGCPTCSAGAGDATGTTQPLPTSVKRIATFLAYKASADAPTQYYASDGSPLTPGEFSQQLQKLPKDSNKSIGVEVVNQPPPAPKPGEAHPNYVRIGCLWMDVRWEEGPVSRCFNLAGVQWHLNFHFRNACSNTEIFNLHAKAWWDNGPQFGLYESAHGWCFNSTGKFTAIRDKFMGMLGLIGITGLAAYLIADISAGVVVAAFAL